MRYLTEEEFDRLIAVKRRVGRTMLKAAARLDDDCEVVRVSNEALNLLVSLPTKKRARHVMCPHCNGQSASREILWGNHLWYRYLIPTPMLCNRCHCEWEPVMRYRVKDGFQ